MVITQQAPLIFSCKSRNLHDYKVIHDLFSLPFKEVLNILGLFGLVRLYFFLLHTFTSQIAQAY